MRSIPWSALWKTLLLGFTLLSISSAYALIGRQPGYLFQVQAASHQPVLKLLLQEDSNDNGDHSVFMPSVVQPIRVELSNVWTADELRTPREAFLPGKAVRYYAQGYVNITDAAVVRLSWSVVGPCGGKTLFDGAGQIDHGQWTLFQSDTAVNCPGIYTYTLRMTYQDKVTIETYSYVVNHPSEVVSISHQGFDKCNIPYGSKTESINQMQTWWNLSPYYSVNLYIGGVSRYCNNTELDAVWVNQVAKQGWSFIPTWVGPQAPCTNYRYRISSDLNTAYYQGISEATAAYETARNLGLLGNTVIYYDMEMYSTTNLSCAAAVNNFLAGWSERLQDHGVRSGVYGHRVNVNNWSAIAYPGTPHNVWIASWIRSYYDPYVSAYGITGVSDSLWRDQRIRQYAGDHVETYGGIGFGIDSNIMDGEVTVLPSSVAGASGVVISSQADEVESRMITDPPASSVHVDDFQLLSSGQGWALVDQKLLWTNDGGNSWADITPFATTTDSVMTAKFIDETHGWSVSQDRVTGAINVLITTNSGLDWDTSPLIEGNTLIGPMASGIYLERLDVQTGWVIVKLVSSANFKPGRLFHTQDGGKSWDEYEVPFGEPVRFLDRERGWIAGGPAENQLFFTQDGGRTWQEQDLSSSVPLNVEEITIGLPEFNDGQGLSLSSLQKDVFLENDLPEGTVKVEIKPDGQGWAHVKRTQCSGIKTAPQTGHIQESGDFLCEKESSILKTIDGGQTWVDITP
jgi:photosystem II stability/assembly factor-like uncharacterized protein